MAVIHPSFAGVALIVTVSGAQIVTLAAAQIANGAAEVAPV
jgi:hypothetical protein